MTDITVGRQKTAHSQARLHVIAAVARTVLEDRRHVDSRPLGSPPQYVPAGLGSVTPARSRADTSGSEMVARLDAAKIAAELTGSDRDLERVLGWERKLKNLDMPSPITARHRNEEEDARQVAERLWRQARGDARAAMQSTERYLEWLERFIASQPEGELERLRVRARGAWRALELAQELRWPGTIGRARKLAQIRQAQADYLGQLTGQHEQRDRILASARARVAASKTRNGKHQPIKRLPDPVYTVTIPALTITAPDLTITLPFQRLQLDLRAANRSDEQTEALRVALGQEAQPVRWNKGRYERVDGIAPEVWSAWETLVDALSVTQECCVQSPGDTQQNCAIA